MKRGDPVTVAFAGDYGTPRPGLVIQSDFFEAHPSVTLLPVTSELRETPLFRVRVGEVIGRLDDETLLAVNRALAVFLGFA